MPAAVWFFTWMVADKMFALLKTQEGTNPSIPKARDIEPPQNLVLFPARSKWAGAGP